MWYTITISKVATMWSNVICFKVNDISSVCLFCVFVPFENFFYLICRRHQYSTPTPFTMVISEDPWHCVLLPSVWQWGFLYLFTVAAWIRTPNLQLTCGANAPTDSATVATVNDKIVYWDPPPPKKKKKCTSQSCFLNKFK